ncbi:diguanylate cyclase domain-containing protein [Cohnella herbarum]|uniref:Diguanylate cyclase n=1 Tax=Cohnella herbarum TaxID=2728023 RepID=A0A7Z2VI16_9BACL|nr:diguanylate cyclase [Cohnella herbarum]QJD83608.1 diguanylate cyclase [Cohnella herbarum]
MEAKKLDIWVIVIAILMYGVVNLFILLPKEHYFENMIMLSLIFAIGIMSYFSGMVISLGLAAVVIFFYGSYVMYGNVILGNAVESHVYYWMVLLPTVAIITSNIGGQVRGLQAENTKMKQEYADYVTVDASTGLDNVKVFYGVLNQHMGLSRRFDLPLSLMLVNIMYFDDIKGIVGSDRMKDILKTIGGHLVEFTRTEDCSYMLEDGRTFALLLFTNKEGAMIVKERIKENIKQLNVDNSAKAVTIKLELKIGISEYLDREQDVIGFRKSAEKDMEYDV